VQRHPHERRLDDTAGIDRGVKIGLPEAFEAGGERDVRRGRMLTLQRRQAADRLRGRDALALEQELARGERRGELLACQDPHGAQRRRKSMALAFTLPDTDGTPTPLHAAARAPRRRLHLQPLPLHPGVARAHPGRRGKTEIIAGPPTAQHRDTW
jgi:hypothetical protein